MALEIERRFLITDLSPIFPWRGKSERIVQGYFEVREGTGKSLRIRITDKTDAEVTVKRGKGVVREERTYPVPLKLAKELLALASHTIEKTRHHRDGWSIDFFSGSLDGVIIAERELKNPRAPCALPAWLGNGVEVTEQLTNSRLARIATVLESTKDPAPAFILRRVLARVPRIVITGGPGSGKSGVLAALAEEFGHAVKFVPEVATILIRNLGVRPGTVPHVCYRFQNAARRVQHVFERAAADAAIDEGKRALALDRGDLDSAAYIPGGVDAYERMFGTTREKDYARYELVVCLAVPPRHIYEKIKRNNPARTESYAEACALGRAIRDAWGGHPSFVYIGNDGGWGKKVSTVRRNMQSFLRRMS